MQSLKKPQIEKLLAQLIQIPSINPNLDKNYNEMQLATFIKNWLKSNHIHAEIDQVSPNRPNVYAEVGQNNGPTLCLCAHLDTVGVQEMTIPPFEPKVHQNRIYGRGSCDMKGGLAAVLSAASALASKKIGGKIILALVCDEEYTSIGAEDYVKKYTADACIVTEPSDLKLLVAHKGFLWGRIKTTGKSAHGSRWDLGESAISKMGRHLAALDTYDKETLRKRVDPLVGPASMHVSLIEGGSGISTYASECTIHIERRTLPSENLEQVKKEIEAIVPGAAVEWYFHRQPFHCHPQEKIVQNVKSAFQTTTGRELESFGWGIWTDAAIFQQAGIPTVNIGPIGYGLHEPVESVDLDSVVLTAEVIYQAAQLFLQPSQN